ncbi:MAG TPA: translocation/assembly module TamB domain-containing protein, partial [Pseudolysinimonas sp.]|nr:translocation/assembly module TamB domain-containing protein [Pseudolysinimonas sp.]
PLDAMAYGVPLRAPAGLRATWSNGRATLDDSQVTLGALAIRAGGDLPVGAPSAAASLEIDGDLGSLAPWLARLDKDQPWTLAGRVKGDLAATRTPAGVALTGSLAATVDSVTRSERVLARQARLSVELTDSRAVVRDFTGHLLGGDVQGAFDAPLTWLNAALPERLWIRPPPTDAPATASLKGTLDVAAAVEEFAPGGSRPVSGRISLAADLSAQRPDLASIVGDLHLDQAELTSGNTTLSQAETTRFRFADGQVHVDAFHWSGPDSVFTGKGAIGLGAGARMQAQVEFDAGVNALADFLKGRGAGRVKGTVAIDGTTDDWTVTADATVADASWLVPEARVLFDGWSGTLRVEPGANALVNLSGRVNGGAVKIAGRLPLASDASDRGGLTLAAQDVLLSVPAGLHSQLGADVTWRQGEAGSAIEGTVTITANRYSEPVTRVLALVESLSRTTGGPDTLLPERLANTTLAVDLEVTDPVVIDNSASSVEILPRLRLVGSLGAPALDGQIEVADQGRIRIGGRTYQLRESRVRFAPANGLAPTLDVTGETRVGDYDVTIRIDGTPGSIETTYTSSPPLGERDLQSLIVTGRVDTPGRATNQEDFAVTAATGDILGFAGRFVGLDSVAIGSADLDLATKDVSTDQHLTVSKSFGNRFEVILSDNLETSAFTWLMTWRPRAGWEVRLASVENTEDSLELRQILYFGPGV